MGMCFQTTLSEEMIHDFSHNTHIDCNIGGAPFDGAKAADGMKVKVDSKAKLLAAWSTDPTIVAAVKVHNVSASAQERAMTNDTWNWLTVPRSIRPLVRQE